MKRIENTFDRLPQWRGAFAVVSCVLTANVASALTPTTAPAKDVRTLAGELVADQKQVNDLIGKHNASLKAAESRQAVAPKLTAPLHRMITNLEALSELVPDLKPQLPVSRFQLLTILSVVGDESADTKMNALSQGKDAADAVQYQAYEWLRKWYVTPLTPPAQAAIVDELVKLDGAHPDSEFLAKLTDAVAKESDSPELADRMRRGAADQMKNPAAISIRQALEAKKRAEEQDKLVANKPLTLAGTLPDGQPFSTASLKGKVVLIDFWAVWCVPCRAGLPRIQKLYDTYHKQGLEIVGVSNDYDVETLRSFTARSNMPWPQLFDAAAAANREMHPLTRSQNIEGIPALYLIDKKGLLRTVNAGRYLEELVPALLAEQD